jgi:YHYH protein
VNKRILFEDVNACSRAKEILIRRKFAPLFSSIIVGSLLLSGCSPTLESTTGSSKDITDAVLTETSNDCGDYAAAYESNVKDVKNGTMFTGQLTIDAGSDSCQITANAIPNYDFNDSTANFATDVAEQSLSFNLPRNPKIANSSTELSLLAYGGVILNGVVLDQVANGCYMPNDPSADSDGNIPNGCGLWVDWRLDPLGKVSLGADSHNAHTQPGGLYHYHGNPYALYDTADKTLASPVIGFAADGFPIYGPRYVDETTGQIVEATSGYTVKSGARPTGDSSPGGSFDGTYIQDYEFTDAGNLDKCNGRTVNGEYGYYVTESYPYVMGCYTGAPDYSFFRFQEIAIWVVSAMAAILGGITVTIVVFVRRIRRNRNKTLSGRVSK